jgi:biopolymer transport protein ExbB/TolQ
MELFNKIIESPFTWGLLLGLLFAGFIWKSAFSAKRALAREHQQLKDEHRDLTTHLNTQLKINASGNQALQSELEELKRQNETLRINLAALQQKPGQAELRQLQMNETAVRLMREQAPGFAAAWEKAMRQAESDLAAADSGLKKLVRRVIPGLGAGSATAPLLVSDEKTDG